MIGASVFVDSAKIGGGAGSQAGDETAIGHERKRASGNRKGRSGAFGLDHLQTPAFPYKIGRGIGDDGCNPWIMARRDERELRTLRSTEQPETFDIQTRHAPQLGAQPDELIDGNVNEAAG